MSLERLTEALGAAPPEALHRLEPDALARLADGVEHAAAWERDEIARGLRRAVRMVPLPLRPVVKGILRT